MTDFEYDHEFWHGPPRFIVLEGDEGGGKSTQAKLLAEWLRGVTSRQVIEVREPGTGDSASKLRELLLDPLAELGTAEEVLLMTAARVDTRLRHVMPALAAGSWVISDRGELSTLVYQGFARNEGALDSIEWLQEFIMRLGVSRRGDLYVVVIVPPEVSVERLIGRGAPPDRFEGEGSEFRALINQGFENIQNLAPEAYRIEQISGLGTKDEVTQRLITTIEAALA